MSGLILLYFVGKQFYKLAEVHGKAKWLFAILGVVVYYAGLIAGQLGFIIILEFNKEGSSDSWSDLALAATGIPIVVICCVGFYFLLKAMWGRETRDNELFDQVENY
ncbi:MAG: hypothetical protein HRT74_00945 [Flavobacteriales bacterium]|nr:hypothetical protein [Flavobacteriales bacterium]